jgi:hypothetical protein
MPASVEKINGAPVRATMGHWTGKIQAAVVTVALVKAKESFDLRRHTPFWKSKPLVLLASTPGPFRRFNLAHPKSLI